MAFANNRSNWLIVLILSLAIGLLAGCTQSPATVASASTAPMTAATSVSDKSEPTAEIRKVTADEALAILKDQPNAVLLDVRTEAEFAEGHIAGAQQLAVEELLDRTDELPADKSTQSSSIAAVAGVQPWLQNNWQDSATPRSMIWVVSPAGRMKW